MFGHCPLNDLCERCRQQAFARLAGVAEARGYQWTLDLEARGISGVWPEASDRARAIARRKVADLAEDPQLIELLAERAELAARRRWSARSAAAHDREPLPRGR